MKPIIIIILLFMPFGLWAQSKGTPQEKAEFLTQIMEKEIPLNEDQVEEVLQINLEMIESIDEARENGEPYSVLKEYSETRNELLMDLLDEEQYQAFESKLPLFREKMNEQFTSE